MRTFLISISAIAAFATAGDAATRNFTVTGFTKVRVEGPYKVTLATGVAPFAKANGSSAALDRVAIETTGDTLIIRTDPNAWGGYPGMDPGPVEINVGTHELSSASLNGSGSLGIDHVAGLTFALVVQGSGAARINDIESDQLNVALAGTTNAKLAGRAKRLTAVVRGLAVLDAATLKTADAHISAEGSATIDAVAAQTAQVRSSGPATIRFMGRPSCELHVSGSTTVSGCK